MPSMPVGSGTSLPERSSKLPLLAFLVVTPVVAYLVHLPYASCGWTWSGVGGVCRSILLISILSGLLAGALALSSARSFLSEDRRRAAVLGALAVVVVVAAMWTAKQFGDYGRSAPRPVEPRPQ